MTGNRKGGLVLQERDRQLLRELGVMRIIDREQTKLVGGFGSTTRVNTRLLALTRAGFLRRVFVGTISGGRKAIYALTTKSGPLVDRRLPALSHRQNLTLAGNLNLEHQMLINSAFVTLKHQVIPVPGVQFLRWISFREPLTQSIRLVPDGYCELDSPSGIRTMFLEIDLGTEPIKTWETKTRNYVQLAVSGEFSRIFSRSQFRVLVVATTDRRALNIRSAIVRITDKIFWLSTFDDIKREGFWSPIWQRPRGDEKHSLV